ncbi:MAG: hypothetical protein VKL39_15420 [Leptolyngbyaceae bacterium]|nr:hypothetical protein [Leptolyngbyaceae bacterium]
MPNASKEPVRLDFDSALSHPRLAFQIRWWRLAMLFLSGASLFLILTLIQLSGTL